MCFPKIPEVKPLRIGDVFTFATSPLTLMSNFFSPVDHDVLANENIVARNDIAMLD